MFHVRMALGSVRRTTFSQLTCARAGFQSQTADVLSGPLVPAVMSSINSARNAPVVAPIRAVIRATVAVAVARIGVTVSRIAVRVRRGVDRVAGIVGWVTTVGWVATVAWVTGTDVDANALGRCFERHKHRQAKSNSAHKNGG